MHNSFSLLSFLLTLFFCSSLGPSHWLQSLRNKPCLAHAVLGPQSFRVNLLHRAWVPAENSCSSASNLLLLWLWYSLSRFSLFFVPSYVHLVLFAQSWTCFYNSTTTSLEASPTPQTVWAFLQWVCCRSGWNYTELTESTWNWLEWTVTSTGKPLVSPWRSLSCSPITTKTLPHKPSTCLNVRSLTKCWLSLPVWGYVILTLPNPFYSSSTTAVQSPAFLIYFLCQNHRRIAKESLRAVRRKPSFCLGKRQRASIGTSPFHLWIFKKISYNQQNNNSHFKLDTEGS